MHNISKLRKVHKILFDALLMKRWLMNLIDYINGKTWNEELWTTHNFCKDQCDYWSDKKEHQKNNSANYTNAITAILSRMRLFFPKTWWNCSLEHWFIQNIPTRKRYQWCARLCDEYSNIFRPSIHW